MAIKLDYDKVPWIVVLPLFALMVIAPVVGPKVFDLGVLGMSLSTIGVLIILSVSVWLSIRLYSKKEF